MSFFRVHETIFSNAGSETDEIYRFQVDKKSGRTELKPTGEFDDVQSYIQSFVQSGNVSMLMDKYQKTKDPSIFQVIPGIYFDSSNLPTSFAEALAMRTDVNNWFYELPTDVREEFNHDPDEFFSSFGSDDFITRINKFVSDNSKIDVVKSVDDLKVDFKDDHVEVKEVN